jgi:hypothetical protein
MKKQLRNRLDKGSVRDMYKKVTDPDPRIHTLILKIRILSLNDCY